MIRTSITHPLLINAVATPGGGLIGMTLCPGKKQHDGLTGHWSRDLCLDLDCIRDWGAVTMVTLMEQHELDRCGVSGIGDAVRKRNITWHHLPIVDASVPDERFEQDWTAAGANVRASLAAGDQILLHCLGGLGRTGTIAARLLIEFGVPVTEAIAQVRAARRGTIETPEQEAYVRRIRPITPSTSTARQPNPTAM